MQDGIKDKLLDSLNSPILQAFEDVKLTPKYIACKLKKKITAKTRKHFCADGKVVSSPKEDDNDAQLKAIDMACKLRGDYPPEKHEHTGADGTPLTPKRIEIVLVKPGDNGNSAL